MSTADSLKISVHEGLRVAIFSDSALPVLNGVSISIDSLIADLRNRGHSVHLFTTAYPGYKDPDPNTHRFRSIDTPIARGYPLAYPPFYRMLRKFRQQDFDLIHTHTPFTLGFVGLRWAESHDVPIVSTYHTLYDRYAHYISLAPRRYVRFRIAKHTNFYYNSVDHVITPSEAAAKWLRRHSVTRPITVVPTGVPRGGLFSRAESRHELGIGPEQKILLYVGRLAREKNLDFLFESVVNVFSTEKEARLWLVGDGPYREECQALVRRLGIGDRVRFVGAVPRQEVDRYYAASDVFVFSSITETQGLVILEAMNYGLPAVAVGGGGASEAIIDGENGLISRPERESLASAILSVLQDERLHAHLSQQALRSAREHGGAEKSVERILNVYRSVLDARQPDQGLYVS